MDRTDSLTPCLTAMYQEIFTTWLNGTKDKGMRAINRNYTTLEIKHA